MCTLLSSIGNFTVKSIHLFCFLCRWRDWSAERFMYYWGLFLEKPEARNDPQFQLISNLYGQVKEKTAGAASTSDNTATSSADKRQRRHTQERQIDSAGNIVR